MAFKNASPRRRRPTVWQSVRTQWNGMNRALRIPIVIFAVLLCYSMISWVVKHYNPIKTVPAEQITFDDSFSASGYFFREEQLIDVSGSDTVEYNYSNGDKVAEGAALITEYKNETALETSRQLEALHNSIDQLQVLQNVSASNQNSSQIKQRIIEQMNALSEEAERPSLSQIGDLTAQLRQLVLKSASMEGDASDISGELKQLQQEAQSLEQQLVGKTTEITSPYAGYFCETMDGYETVFTLDQLDDLDAAKLEKLAGSQKKVKEGKGRIITGYDWYFAAVVDSAEVSGLETGNSVKLRFAQVQQDVSATVYAIRPESSDESKTLIIFQSQDMNEELAVMRKQVATVVSATYTGLKVPKDAVRMVDDKMGVYVLTNQVSSYKNVEVLFEDDDFYIVKQNVIGDDSLVVGDDIIVKAKELDDKKVVK